MFEVLADTEKRSAVTQKDQSILFDQPKDTQTPETKLGNHSPAKAGFLSASQMEVFCFGSLAMCHK
jgi:hypothetical protein